MFCLSCSKGPCPWPIQSIGDHRYTINQVTLMAQLLIHRALCLIPVVRLEHAPTAANPVIGKLSVTRRSSMIRSPNWRSKLAIYVVSNLKLTLQSTWHLVTQRTRIQFRKGTTKIAVNRAQKSRAASALEELGVFWWMKFEDRWMGIVILFLSGMSWLYLH